MTADFADQGGCMEHHIGQEVQKIILFCNILASEKQVRTEDYNFYAFFLKVWSSEHLHSAGTGQKSYFTSRNKQCHHNVSKTNELQPHCCFTLHHACVFCQCFIFIARICDKYLENCVFCLFYTAMIALFLMVFSALG